MADKVNLSHAFGLAPKEVVAYFKSKGYMFTWDYTDANAEAHLRGFTAAKITSLDVLTAVRSEMDKAFTSGQTLREFQKILTPRLQDLGWWGIKESLDLDTGEIRREKLGSPRRLETIYRENFQRTYAHARRRQVEANSKERPYCRWVHGPSKLPRQSHLALDGRVFKWSDPIWRKISPDREYGCTCTMQTLSADEVKREGVTVESSEDYIETIEDKDADGNPITRHVIKMPGMQYGMPITDPYGEEPLALTDLTTAALEKAINAYPRDASHVIGEIFGRDEILKVFTDDFGAWINELDLDKPSGARRLVGALPQQVIDGLRDQGILLQSAVISITDKQLAHGLRGTADGDGHLTRAQWATLPQMLNTPEAILLDKSPDRKTPSLLYILPAAKGKDKIVVSLDYYHHERWTPRGQKGVVHTNSVTTGYTIRDPGELFSVGNFPVLYGIWSRKK